MSPALRRKLGAGTLFAGLSVALGHFLNLPQAIAIDSETDWYARHGETMRFAGVRGDVLSVEGAVGEPATLYADSASLDEETRSELTAIFSGAAVLDMQARQSLKLLGAEKRTAPARITWSFRGGGESRADIRVRTGDMSGATITIVPPADDQDAEIALRADGGSLLIEAGALVVGRNSGSVLEIDGRTLLESEAGATPVAIVVPKGEGAQIDVPAETRVRYRLGNPELELESLAVIRRSGRERKFVCGADEGTISWLGKAPNELRCSPTITASAMKIDDGVRVRLIGSGFVLNDRTVARSSWYQNLMANPLIGALIVALYAAIATWTIRTMTEGANPSAKRVRRRRATESAAQTGEAAP